MQRRPPSLLKRLWLASLLVLPVFLGSTAYMLNRAYVNSLNSAEQQALLAQVYALLALAEPEGDQLSLPSSMANPRFETPESGLYALVLETGKAIKPDETIKPVWRSNSLELSQLSQLPMPPLSPQQPGIAHSERIRINNEDYQRLSFATIWEINQQERRFRIDVIQSQKAKYAEIKAYQKALFLWLGCMGLVLFLMQIIITRWGLKPLARLAQEINAIEQGASRQMQAQYPKEIEPVTQSLNALLNSESAQQERYKNSLADLAHSLKTPLSVIRAQLKDSDKDQIVDEQVERMNGIISHQLRRASAGVQAIYGPSTDLAPLIERLCKAMTKVYRDKNLEFDLNLPDGLQCAIEQDDLMEVLGNLIENASKYGKKYIHIDARETADFTEIIIADDGPGVDESISSQILERGARADTSKTGQGIGLAIAVDILSSYNGGLTISRSSAGGAAFTLSLPRAKQR